MVCLVLLVLAGAWPSRARGESCGRAEFEGAVGEAARLLRDLNVKNKPAYQAKLRQLKEKRGWSNEAFMTEAAPLVQDEKVLAYDQKSGDLLAQINTMGQAGGQVEAAGGAADCALLGELRGFMTSLVATQQEKWTYMFTRIDAELAK